MKQVTMYGTQSCSYCQRAKELLDKKAVEYTDIRVDEHPEKRQEMEQLSQRRTVPQIFIGDQHIGGCDELYALEAAGELDDLLK